MNAGLVDSQVAAQDIYKGLLSIGCTVRYRLPSEPQRLVLHLQRNKMKLRRVDEDLLT